LEDGIQQTQSFLVIPRIAPGNQTWLAGAQWALQCWFITPLTVVS
jgi:hypothetical protein